MGPDFLKIDSKRPIAVIFERLGPYHRARLAAASELLKIAAVEVFERDSTYSWTVDRAAIPCFRVTLFANTKDVTSGRHMFSAVSLVLDRLDPCCVVIPGWSANYSISALNWCVKRGVPAVLMSDSTIFDATRHWWSEYLKSRLVGLFGSALVAGKRHVEYVETLGKVREGIFTGYDVVDNNYFATGAKASKAKAHETAFRFSLPKRYFLASARFVEKKNLFVY